MTKLYRNFASQEEIDLEYNLALTVPDIDTRLRNYTGKSKIVRKEYACTLDIKYDPGSSFCQTIADFVCQTIH
jgi:arylformamidase